MSGSPNALAPRWGPLTPQTWPQDENAIPSTPGMPMPPISAANAQRSKRESFTMVGGWQIPFGNAAGQQFGLTLPTDQDGDFWCDQIYMCAWFTSLPAMVRPPPSTISIADMRTGLALTYPAAIPTNFLTTLLRFSDDPGFDVASSPFPDGFRSTTTLAQPYCFTRAGGIILNLTLFPATVGPDNLTVDIAFGGWKEYENAAS